MSDLPRQTPPLFTHVDVSGNPSSESLSDSNNSEAVALLHQLLSAQNKQNHLLEELVKQMSATQRQRANELGQWRQANPELSQHCRKAAESLSQVQTEFLQSLTQEITENIDTLMDGEFMLNEFVDRYGPRLAHLNGVLNVLSQLSTNPNTNSQPPQ